jgi:hypothetical protein
LEEVGDQKENVLEEAGEEKEKISEEAGDKEGNVLEEAGDYKEETRGQEQGAGAQQLWEPAPEGEECEQPGQAEEGGKRRR